MSIHYSAKIADDMPHTLGSMFINRTAHDIAQNIASGARAVHGPVVWITGNSYMPPLRSIAQAEYVWQHGDLYGDDWEYLTVQLDHYLSEEEVYLASPDYDNALYAVDLKRWQYKELPPGEYIAGETLDDEWEARPE